MKKTTHIVGSFTSIPNEPLTTNDCDIIEVRLDTNNNEEALSSFLKNTQHPLLFTARDIKEGGVLDLNTSERISRLAPVLNQADYIDVEMKNWADFQSILTQNLSENFLTVASYHDFTKTPLNSELNDLLLESIQTGADIHKFAFMTHTLDDIARCQTLLLENPTLKISIMGMGAYAPVSRVLLAQSGSVLNYGFLGSKETAPGQWPAKLLKQAITMSMPIT